MSRVEEKEEETYVFAAEKLSCHFQCECVHVAFLQGYRAWSPSDEEHGLERSLVKESVREQDRWQMVKEYLESDI